MFSLTGQSPIQMISRVIFGQGMSCLEACRKSWYERSFFAGPVPAPPHPPSVRVEGLLRRPPAQKVHNVMVIEMTNSSCVG